MASLVSIANGQADLATLRAVALARRSRNLLVLKAIVDLTASRSHPQAPAAELAFHRLAEIECVAPQAVAAVVHHPPVTAWAFRTLRLLDTGHDARADPGRLTSVAAAAAVRAGAAVELDLIQTIRSGEQFVALPTLGRAIVSGPGPIRLSGSPAGFEVVGARTRVAVPTDPHRTAGNWQGLPRLTATHRGRGISVLLDVLEAGHAAETTIVEDEPYSAHAVRQWQSQLDGAWQLLARHHTRVAEEIAALVTVLVPLTALPLGTASATPSDAFGAVAMTRPQNPTWFALSLAHEVQHVKLTAVTDLFRLLDAEQEDLYYAPWRTDPRPTFGLLHGMYAHLGVAGFWQRQLSHLSGEPALQAEIEFARWRSAAMEVGQTLAVEARLTPAGRIFLGGMIDTIDRLRAVAVSAAAIDAATRLSNAHRASWSANNSGGSS